MNRIKTLSSLYAVISFTLVMSSAASACLCNVQSLAKRKSQSQSIFVGTLIKRTRESQDGRLLWRNQFAVERYWKGNNASEVTIYTTSDDCAPWFEIGEKYLVLAYFVKEGQHLETEICMGTRRVELAAKDLKKLGDGRRVQ